METVIGLEGPDFRAGCGIERIDMMIAAAEIDPAVFHQRRGKPEIPRIGRNAFGFRHSIAAGHAEARFAAGLEAPQSLAGGRIKRRQAAVAAQDIKPAIRGGGRRADPAFGVIEPDLFMCRQVEGVEIAVFGGDIEEIANNDR